MEQIKLGQEVRCLLSGVTGLVSARVEQLNGNVRYAVQPKSADGTAMPDAWDIDHQSLEVVGPGISDRAIEPVKTNILLGQKVHDRVSHYEGIAVSKHTYLNGCVSFQVVPPMRKEAAFNDAPVGSYISVERLDVMNEKSIIDRSIQPKTGGPAVRSVRM